MNGTNICWTLNYGIITELRLIFDAMMDITGGQTVSQIFFQTSKSQRETVCYQACDAGLCKRPLQVSRTFCVSLTKINVQAAAVSSELALMLE